jgi:glycosyltransferase involved in cell wall biosynthesis
MSRDRIRVALVMDHPAQQFTRGLQLLAAEPDVEAQVYYWSVAQRFHDDGFGREVEWDVDLLDGYTWAGAPEASAITRLRWLLSHLRKARPDVVVTYGWGSSIARASIIFCLLTGTRILLYGDSTWQHPSLGWRRAARAVGLHILTRVCTGAVSTGVFNREFYLMYGMNPRSIWPGVCPADTGLFGQSRIASGGAIRAGSQQLRIGFAGKLIEIKGADELLHAAALLPAGQDWSITMVGDGPLRGELQALTTRLGVEDRVSFSGFANVSEMPKLLAGFDVVVVPSRLDRRTLVTIEAMAAGAAVVVSDATAVWGPGDLIEDGVTGLLYPSGDPAALAGQLRRLLSDRELLGRLQRDGKQRAAGFGPESFAATMASATRMCMAGH